MKFTIFLKCWLLGNHDWTSAAMKGRKPTKEQLVDYEGFKDYAAMYCKRCGKFSELNKRL